MSIFKNHERKAENITVSITEPFPRWVDITKDSCVGGSGFQGLSIKEAEALHFALGKALEDAHADGECK